METSIFDFLRDVLLLEKFENFDEATRRKQIDFVLKFQQCTGPIMAKGLEDTAFYIFNRLVALNEVGGDPKQFGISIERFHERNRLRLAETRHTLLALTSHDTKRSEDTRARITVLSELPQEWENWINQWRETNRALKTDLDGDLAPSFNEEYLIYQTLLGTWPFEEAGVDEQYIARIRNYHLKALKEAKVNSSWIQPNEDWEKAVVAFIDGILDAKHGFRAEFAPAAARVAAHGMLNSLSQTILKLTVPGVPDLYQGTELWDFSLVDPDNRRPVDYDYRTKALEQIGEATIEDLFRDWQTGLIKMAIVTRLLHLRKKHPDIFQMGDYQSVYAKGPQADCCVCFTRGYDTKRLLVIVPRLTTRLTTDGKKFTWKETELLFDEDLPAMLDLFSERRIKAGTEALYLERLATFPFAVYHNLG
jgi:(1->4)-alpha-D-glucan 1-alpha-D-glucosylmutase